MVHVYQMHHVALRWSERRFTVVLQEVSVTALCFRNVEPGRLL